MALLWLDLVRFADSRGYHSDNPRNVGSYRDYVIQAFNENMPFDRFTTEQLAGDLLPEAGLRQKVASGYNKLNLTTEEGGAQAREYEAKTAADRVRNASGVWMGATLGCAECHDHKFDPFTTKDFYRFASFFADVSEGAIGDGDKGILVPTDAQAIELKRYEDGIAALKKTLDTPTPELAAAQTSWEKRALIPADWTVLQPESIKAKDGSTFFVEEDGSVIVTGKPVAKDTHTFTATVSMKGRAAPPSGGADLAHASEGRAGRLGRRKLPAHEPDGQVGRQDRGAPSRAADFSQDKFPIADVLDEKKETGWGVLKGVGQDRTAVVEFKEPFGTGEATPLTVTLDYRSNQAEHLIGRFRLSVTSDETPSAAITVPAKIRAILEGDEEKRTDAQKKDLAATTAASPRCSKASAPNWQTRRKIPGLREDHPALADRKPAAPRTVRVLLRGNWLDATGEVVTPGVPRS
jgi:hypothetical protein